LYTLNIMSVKLTYQVKQRSAPVKSSRIVKKTAAMPLKGNFVIKGASLTRKTKTFRFSILSASQQLKERNKAYHFFSID
jgi:hypothetical protein